MTFGVKYDTRAQALNGLGAGHEKALEEVVEDRIDARAPAKGARGLGDAFGRDIDDAGPDASHDVDNCGLSKKWIAREGCWRASQQGQNQREERPISSSQIHLHSIIAPSRGRTADRAHSIASAVTR
jgi:hypothetical protein